MSKIIDFNEKREEKANQIKDDVIYHSISDMADNYSAEFLEFKFKREDLHNLIFALMVQNGIEVKKIIRETVTTYDMYVREGKEEVLFDYMEKEKNKTYLDQYRNSYVSNEIMIEIIDALYGNYPFLKSLIFYLQQAEFNNKKIKINHDKFIGLMKRYSRFDQYLKSVEKMLTNDSKYFDITDTEVKEKSKVIALSKFEKNDKDK